MSELLRHAIEYEHIEVIDFLMKKGEIYHTPFLETKLLKLHKCLGDGNKPMVKLLLKLKVPYEKLLEEYKDKEGWIYLYNDFKKEKQILNECLKEI